MKLNYCSALFRFVPLFLLCNFTLHFPLWSFVHWCVNSLKEMSNKWHQGLPLCRGVNVSTGELIRFKRKGRGDYFSKNVHVALITRYKDLRNFHFKKKTEVSKVDFQSTGFDRKINSREERAQHFCEEVCFENKLFFLWFLLCFSEIYPAEISYVFVPKPRNFTEFFGSNSFSSMRWQ